MKVTSISFMQTFPTGNFSNQKLGVEIDVSDEISHSKFLEIYQYAKDTVNQAFKALNPELTPILHDHNTGISSAPPVIDRRKEEVLDMINDCTAVWELEKIKADADKYNLSDVWYTKYGQLS